MRPASRSVGPDLRTIQILDNCTETVGKRIPAQTTMYRELYWRYQYKYLTTTNLCLLMWNHRSPVFHFNWLALDCTATATKNSTKTATAYRWLNGLTKPLPNAYLLSVQRQALQTVTRNSYGINSFRCCSRNCHAEHRGTSPSRNLQTDTTTLATVRRRHLYSSSQRRNRRFSLTPQQTERWHIVY